MLMNIFSKESGRRLYCTPYFTISDCQAERSFLASGDTNGTWGIVNSQENDYTGFGFEDED